MSSGICPADAARVGTVSWEEGCGKNYTAHSKRECRKRVDDLNRKIRAYNAFIAKCRRAKREEERAKEQARQKELERQRQQEEERRRASSGPEGLKRELDRLRQGYENAPAHCPRFPASPECRDWAKYDDIFMNQMSDQEREAYLQECCPEQIEENRREAARTEEMMRQAREKAERDSQRRAQQTRQRRCRNSHWIRDTVGNRICVTPDENCIKKCD